MIRDSFKQFGAGFYARLLLFAYALFFIIRWPVSPLFIDIYYHLHTAWAFTKSGGYSGWDFWQYAPVGRPHIYPPLFHLLLAFLMKAGLNTIILAKLSEIFIPIAFLFSASILLKNNFGAKVRLAFFIMLGSSFSFLISLINHIPATLALTFGILCLDQLLRGKLMRSAILLTFCFYTHTGVSLFFTAGLVVFSLLERISRKISLSVISLAILFSFPIILKQAINLNAVAISRLGESYLCEFKTLDYFLAFLGLFISFRQKEYKIFLSLFLGSFVFAVHPYRFFSGEGYLAVIFLSAIALKYIYESLKGKSKILAAAPLAITFFVLFISPSVLMSRDEAGSGRHYKFYNFDSALLGMAFPEHNKRTASQTLWFPKEYMETVSLIKANSEEADIVHSRFNVVSVIIGSLAGRPVSGGLFTEVPAEGGREPLKDCKVFIATKEDGPGQAGALAEANNLEKIGENKIFSIYKNDTLKAKVDFPKASVPFWAVLATLACFLALFFCKKI